MKDQLSALMDGELELASSDHIFTSIKSGGELKTAWKDYHLIGDALRGELSVHPSCCDKIIQALDAEPALFPVRASDVQPATPTSTLVKSALFSSKGWSVAASVAAVMFVGLMVLQQQMSTSAPEEMAPIEIANSMPLEYLRAHQSSAPSGSAYFIQDANFVEPK